MRDTFPYPEDRALVTAFLRGTRTLAPTWAGTSLANGKLHHNLLVVAQYDRSGALWAQVRPANAMRSIVRLLNYLLELAGVEDRFEPELTADNQLSGRLLFRGQTYPVSTPIELIGPLGVKAVRAALK